ncbi:MAG: glycosyl hydrolase family 8 [Thiomonas sp.]|jgi:endoglucanase
MPTRRHILQTVAAASVLAELAPAAWAAPLLQGVYTAWKQAFVQPDGRVVDPGQQNATTSEGQGYGMILALAAGDTAGFDAMWGWTQKHLAIRDDALLAWRWIPGQGVPDKNDAADSDLLIAWALARASLKRPDLASPARAIAQAIRAKLLRDTPWGTVLLPAVQGFDTPKGQVINLSYWVFPALPDLARIDPSPQWEALRTSGLKLLSIARFGRWGLPPDWLLLVNPLVPDPTRPQRYGYEAVRIPLYLAWAGLATPALLAPFRAFWGSFHCENYLPAWTNFSDDSIDSFGASPGMRDIRDWVESGRAPRVDSKSLAQAGYYSATLAALVQVAAVQAAAARP